REPGTGSREDRGVHHDDVAHREERRDARDDLAGERRRGGVGGHGRRWGFYGGPAPAPGPAFRYSRAMCDWLLQREPSEDSVKVLLKEKKTVWTGVRNPVAQRNLAAMKANDRLVVYHTGDERRAVGLASVASAPKPDPKDPKSALVEIEAGKALAAP